MADPAPELVAGIICALAKGGDSHAQIAVHVQAAAPAGGDGDVLLLWLSMLVASLRDLVEPGMDTADALVAGVVLPVATKTLDSGALVQFARSLLPETQSGGGGGSSSSAAATGGAARPQDASAGGRAGATAAGGAASEKAAAAHDLGVASQPQRAVPAAGSLGAASGRPPLAVLPPSNQGGAASLRTLDSFTNTKQAARHLGPMGGRDEQTREVMRVLGALPASAVDFSERTENGILSAFKHLLGTAPDAVTPAPDKDTVDANYNDLADQIQKPGAVPAALKPLLVCNKGSKALLNRARKNCGDKVRGAGVQEEFAKAGGKGSVDTERRVKSKHDDIDQMQALSKPLYMEMLANDAGHPSLTRLDTSKPATVQAVPTPPAPPPRARPF